MTILPESKCRKFIGELYRVIQIFKLKVSIRIRTLYGWNFRGNQLKLHWSELSSNYFSNMYLNIDVDDNICIKISVSTLLAISENNFKYSDALSASSVKIFNYTTVRPTHQNTQSSVIDIRSFRIKKHKRSFVASHRTIVSGAKFRLGIQLWP